METTALIDADIFAFQASSATERVWYFNGPEEEPAVDANLDAAIQKIDGDIERIVNVLKATAIVVCLTDTENFRTALYPAYKGNRKNKRRPTYLKEVREHLARKYNTYQRPGLEADDCMGVLATHPTLFKGKKVMVSEDKDMETVPALLFNPRRDRCPRLIKPVEALRKFMAQALTGDPVDGYPGCPGIGAKSAFVLALQSVETEREMWQIVVEGYESKGLTEADALVQARMARILRASDWDFEKKRPRLWTPPTRN